MHEAMLHDECLCAHATAIGRAFLIESSVGPIYLYNEMSSFNHPLIRLMRLISYWYGN